MFSNAMNRASGPTRLKLPNCTESEVSLKKVEMHMHISIMFNPKRERAKKNKSPSSPEMNFNIMKAIVTRALVITEKSAYAAMKLSPYA